MYTVHTLYIAQHNSFMTHTLTHLVMALYIPWYTVGRTHPLDLQICHASAYYYRGLRNKKGTVV